MKTKITLKILFLILAAVCSSAFAQSEKENQAYKFFEYGKASGSLLKEKFDGFYETLKKDSSLQGYIINYGTEKEIAKRQAQILKEMRRFREGADSPRVTFINGGNKFKAVKTILWIVPAGVPIPQP